MERDEDGTPSVGLFDSAPAARLLANHAQLDYPYQCQFGEASLIINRGVFCPVLTNTSLFLLDSITLQAGERVLDVFSGSGAFGIVAALRGARSVLVEISPVAVECARNNAKLNGVSHRVDARLGTMHTALNATEKFDCIIANPPLLPGVPADDLGAAVFDPQLQATVDFIASVPPHLSLNGRAYLLTSDVFERFGYRVEELCSGVSLAAELVAVRRLPYEQYRVHLITAVVES